MLKIINLVSMVYVGDFRSVSSEPEPNDAIVNVLLPRN